MRDFHLPGRSPVLALNGMCATSHPLAAKVAVGVLEEGGNAMDAALAGAVLLGICEPQMTGIGGDLFALFSPAGSEDVLGFNGSGRAPAGLDAAALRAGGADTMPAHGHGASVTVPGAVDAICRLSADWGRWDLGRTLAPSIRYAEEGVPVAARVAADWVRGAANLHGHGRTHFLKDGRPLLEGEVFRAPGQAEVLRRIARDGRSAFYEGEVAADMIAALREAGGTHTEADFAGCEGMPTTPVSGRYGGHELLEHPPNGQGAAAILLLNILGHFDLSALAPFGAERVHLEAEATKLAYDARNRMIADPDHTARLEHLLDPGTARALAGLIRPDRVLPPARLGTEAVHKDTVYITVVDRDRMAVSLIYSIFHSFGSGLASERFGINFQNRGAGFTLEAGHPNEAGPGKRPMHTIIPGMVRKDGRVVMPFGVMGGQYQSTGHARFLSNLLDHGLGLQAAIDGPRAFASGGDLWMERGFDPEVRQALADLGHAVVDPPTAIGGAQAIRIGADGVLEGASDPRKDGCALGF